MALASPGQTGMSNQPQTLSYSGIANRAAAAAELDTTVTGAHRGSTEAEMISSISPSVFKTLKGHKDVQSSLKDLFSRRQSGYVTSTLSRLHKHGNNKRWAQASQRRNTSSFLRSAQPGVSIRTDPVRFVSGVCRYVFICCVSGKQRLCRADSNSALVHQQAVCFCTYGPHHKTAMWNIMCKQHLADE